MDLRLVDQANAKLDAKARRREKPSGDEAGGDPLAALSRWVVTDEQVQAMSETKLIWRDTLAESHMAAWCGPAGSGKTAMAKFAAGELAKAHRVLFFQEDASAGDIPEMHRHATANGYQLLNSTLAGSSTEDQIAVLRKLVKAGSPLTGVVFFFDTLKKFADLMSKGGARAFFKLMRSLTQLGATVVLLGHTNKHRGLDGKLMFEGVGDVRNDVDELIYIDATEKDPFGMVTITMRPDKTRCAIGESSYELNTQSRRVRPLDRVVNVAAIVNQQRQREADASVIDAVRTLLAKGGMNFTDLRNEAIEASGKSRAVVTEVLERYISADLSDQSALWIETRLRVNNTRHVSLKPRQQ